MAWVLRSPQIHSTFSNLGFTYPDGYHINENCNAALELILNNILTEDPFQRPYRKSIRVGQNIKKDLIPLLIHAKDDKTIELLIKILVNLSIPVECLLSMEVTAKTDIGRHTIYEINSLLASTKIALTDHRVTKVIIDFLKKNIEIESSPKLSMQRRSNICNTLLFLRNVLHIPEEVNFLNCEYGGPPHTIQNQILWNLFSQSIDKVLLRLITIPEAIQGKTQWLVESTSLELHMELEQPSVAKHFREVSQHFVDSAISHSIPLVDQINWAVTMVQLIALLYKDQHVTTLHKLLNVWLETSLSESSEDNESNTSPQTRGSEHSSPILTSDPTSDSSDGVGSGKSDEDPISGNTWNKSSSTDSKTDEMTNKTSEDNKKTDFRDDNHNTTTAAPDTCKNDRMENETISEQIYTEKGNNKRTASSENSDCECVNQMENQEVTTTSSNEDELPAKKPHIAKQRINNKTRSSVTLQERKRKKIVKRGKVNIINFKGLPHKAPTDDDISNVLKEFTVDFLIKGYNSLVQTLYTQILRNVHLEIDTSHFFWLVTYFLKFATQIELDLEHVCSVLSFDIISYLTAEGVNLCEQFELSIKMDGNDLKPCVRRLHLAVTAIREIVQAIEVYKKSAHICNNDKERLVTLQKQMCETDELRSLLVLLLRHYNPIYHSKQYLQDLIVTNHILLMCLDNMMRSPDNKSTNLMVDHIRQFAAPEIMYQYGLLLEDYEGNGEFVNDCVFTMMHHVAGELGCLVSLFQPKILKTFTSIWKTEFEICDDWSDIIEYAINTFVKKPHKLQMIGNMRMSGENYEESKKHKDLLLQADELEKHTPEIMKPARSHSKEKWSEPELSSLSWYYMQCKTKSNLIGEIVNLFKEDGVIKTRESIVKELFHQYVIDKEEHDTLLKNDADTTLKVVQETKKLRENEIGKLCEQLSQDGKSQFLDWVQTVLLETCYAKICLKKLTLAREAAEESFETFAKNADAPVVSPVSYHSLIYNQSVPLVPWNCQQAAICKDLKFLQLIHKLGFQMPVDTGKVFIRIPNFWTAEFMYEVAGKISPIDSSKLKFSLEEVSQRLGANAASAVNSPRAQLHRDACAPQSSENFYQVHKERHHATLLNFTPMPGSSFNSGQETKPNWLELVQKAQEYKITMDLGKSIMKNSENSEKLQLGVSSGSERAQTDAEDEARCDSPPAHDDMSVKPDSANQNDFEYYNNSICETASVASDLTRMYVSDEDDKSDIMTCPVSPLKLHEHPSESGDLHCIIAKKRARTQLLGPF